MAAQKHSSFNQYPTLLKFEVAGHNDRVPHAVVRARVSGDGRSTHRKFLNLLANKEWGRTKQYLKDSVGWVLLFDGASKLAYKRAFEAFLFHDVDAHAQHRVRLLFVTHCTPQEMEELRSVDAKPYGAVAQFRRLCKKMKERYGDPNDIDGELPPIMDDLLQLAYDGASENHALHTVIQDKKFDVLGVVDARHQLDCAVVHDLRESTLYPTYLAAVRGTTTTILGCMF